MEKRGILPYLNVNVVVFALNFYKGSFQFHHKSFTHAPVLWKNIEVRESWPHPRGEKGRAAIWWRRPGSRWRTPVSLYLPQRAPGGTLSFLQQLEGSEDALHLLPGAAFLSLTRGCQPWSSQWQLGHHPHPDRVGVSGVHLPKRAQHLPSWQCGCRLLEDTKHRL